MNPKKYLVLFVILLLGLNLRIWNISSNPPGLTWDEVALGYNTYSILQTGKDEYGNFLPLNLKSFGDYKPAFYAYLTVPFVGILGLNEMAVRLPSVLSGVFAIILTFLLVENLFKNKWLSLFSSFFLAISPWHIQFSRPAFEANVALTLNLFGAYLLIKGLKNSKFLIPSSLLFGLSLFTYQGSKVFVPLIILGAFFCFKANFRKTNESIVALGLLGISLILVFATTFLTGQTQRLNTQNFFAYQRSTEEISLISKEDGLEMNSFVFQLLHGEWWNYIRGLAERYLIYFSPKMLFIDGDYSERHSVPDLGALYYFSIILIPFGFYKLIKDNSSASKLILVWLILAPIPAVLSRDLISTLRALNMVFPWVVLEAFGLYWILSYVRNLDIRIYRIAAVLAVVIIGSNIMVFIDRYFIHAPKEYSMHWLYGYRQVFSDLGDVDKYRKIVITDKLGQPYIYYLFYRKYPPEKFQKQALLDQPTIDVGSVKKIDSIEFRPIFWPSDRGEKNSLFIGTLFELPDQDILPFPEYKILKDVKFLNGEFALRVVETKP